MAGAASTGLRRAAELLGVQVPEFVDPAEHHVVVNAHRLHYLDWGTAGRPPALFLHGHGLTAHTWDLVALSLRPHLHCFAPDLRGHGDSEWSPVMDYRVDTHATDIRGLVASVADAPAVLIGMSLGGIVALQCAAALGDAVRGLVIVDIGPESEQRFRAGMAKQGDADGAKKLVNFLTTPTELDTVEDFVQHSLAFNPRRDAESLRSSLLNNLRQTPRGTWTWKYDRRHHEPPADGTAKHEPPPSSDWVWDLAEQVTCPVLVVRGAESPVLSADGAADLSSRFGQSRWAEVPKAGHSVQGDNPGGFVDAVLPFLNELGVTG